MEIEMIKKGPINGRMRVPGDVVTVHDELGQRLIDFQYAREADKSSVKTTEKKADTKTADKQPAKTAEKKIPGKKTANRE